MRPITRRGFIVLGGLAAGGGVAALLSDGDRGSSRLSRTVAASFSDAESARAVGEAYLEKVPSEDDVRRLGRALRRSNSAWGRVVGAQDVRRLARAEIRRDYAAGRIVAVSGWYLSRTEARLCALATFA